MNGIMKFLILGAVISLGMISCRKEGPMEKAGEKIDNGVKNAADAVEEATER